MSDRQADTALSGEFVFRAGEISPPATLKDSRLEQHICMQLVVAGNQFVTVSESKRQQTSAERGNWLVRTISHIKSYRWIANRNGQFHEFQITTEVEERPIVGDEVSFAPPASRSEKLTNLSGNEETGNHMHPLLRLRALERRLHEEENVIKSATTNENDQTNQQNNDQTNQQNFDPHK